MTHYISECRKGREGREKEGRQREKGREEREKRERERKRDRRKGKRGRNTWGRRELIINNNVIIISTTHVHNYMLQILHL